MLLALVIIAQRIHVWKSTIPSTVLNCNTSDNIDLDRRHFITVLVSAQICEPTTQTFKIQLPKKTKKNRWNSPSHHSVSGFAKGSLNNLSENSRRQIPKGECWFHSPAIKHGPQLKSTRTFPQWNLFPWFMPRKVQGFVLDRTTHSVLSPRYFARSLACSLNPARDGESVGSHPLGETHFLLTSSATAAPCVYPRTSCARNILRGSFRTEMPSSSVYIGMCVCALEGRTGLRLSANNWCF